MGITGNFTIKEARATEPGELVRVASNDGTGSLGFIIGPEEEGGPPMLLAFQPRLKAAAFQVSRLTGPLVSGYGSDWIIECPDNPESYPSNKKFRGQVGVVLRSQGSSHLVVLDRQWGDIETINLDNMTFERSPEDYAPVPQWRLWANPKHRDRAGAKPLFEFVAQPAP